MAKKDDFIELNEAIDKKLNDEEKKVIKEYAEVLANIKNALATAFEKYSNKDGILTREEMVRYGRLTKLENYIVEQIQRLTKTQIRLTSNAIREIFLESYYRYGYFIEKQVELAIYNLIDSETIDQMLLNNLDLVTWEERVEEHANTLSRQLREYLVIGLVQGLPYSNLAKEVTKRMNVGLNKALRIVRTESRRVQELANLQTMKEASNAGVIAKKMWVSTLDKRTRDTHKHLDGQIVGIDEKFKSRSGYTALAPHQFGVPEEDINCRCTMIIHIDDLEPKARRARKDDGKNEVISYKTYNDWLKGLESR